MALPTLSFENPTFANFAFYSILVVLKMLFLAFLTSGRRMLTGVFSSQEDVNAFYKGTNPDKSKPIFNNQSVERVRRNHLNDLENIPAFILTGLFYVLIGPSPWMALWHFRVFGISRILHTISYQLAIPQPARALCFTCGVTVTISMAVQVLMAI